MKAHRGGTSTPRACKNVHTAGPEDGGCCPRPCVGAHAAHLLPPTPPPSEGGTGGGWWGTTFRGVESLMSWALIETKEPTR